LPTKPFTARDVVFKTLGPPRYEQLAEAIEAAIRDGGLHPGDRIPPVRELAGELGVSVTTVTSAFDLLSDRRLIRAEVGRGTFVAEFPAAKAVQVAEKAAIPRRGRASPWRRRSLMTLGARLRALYPTALDCSTGRPDVTLLPLPVLRRAWASISDSTTAADLQYAGLEVIEPLARLLIPLLERDAITARPEDLLIGSSAQQLMMLSFEVAVELYGRDKAAIAVEEPGYPTIMDAFERAGARLISVAIDQQGAIPQSLDAALRSGAIMVLLTPAAHNPTGASWSARRRSELASVLAQHPNVLAVEDDQFAGIASTRPGSLLGETNVSDRVIYIRSFSKSIGPDLRLAAAVARPRLRAFLAEAKSFADGWTSRLLQKMLAAALADDELPGLLAGAREEYRRRRWHAAEALNIVLQDHGGWTWCGPDGLNLWVHLPPGLDAAEVAERAAAAGVRVAPGEPFFIRPGHSYVLRLNAGSVPAEKASEAGRITAEAALVPRSKEHSLIHV
jgi:GntR family transcriptional regulator/MocR family aminotransferase